jgi:hypothetical protein
MSFPALLIIWLAVLFAAYVGGWIAHIMGRRTRSLSGVSYSNMPPLNQLIAAAGQQHQPGVDRDHQAGDDRVGHSPVPHRRRGRAEGRGPGPSGRLGSFDVHGRGLAGRPADGGISRRPEHPGGGAGRNDGILDDHVARRSEQDR